MVEGILRFNLISHLRCFANTMKRLNFAIVGIYLDLEVSSFEY